MNKWRVKSSVLITLFLWSMNVCGQHVLIPTGTTTNIDEIRKFGDLIVLNGNYQFLVKCYDDCDVLTPLTLPKTYYENSSIVLQDTNRFYVCSYDNGFINHQLVFKTINGGQSWDSIFENPGPLHSMQLLVFDTNFLSVSTGDYIYMTEDGGENWEVGHNLEETAVGSSLRINDSLGIFGGSPNLVLTNDKGISWMTIDYIADINSNAIYGSHPDSIYLVSGDLPSLNKFSYIFGGFQSARVDKNLPMLFPKGLYVVSKNEIYVVGKTLFTNIGRIMKTIDLGETWTYYDVPEASDLSSFVFLNDSIALIGGNNGVLLKWNKNSPMSELPLSLSESMGGSVLARVYPNPIVSQQVIEIKTIPGDKIDIQLYDLQGRFCSLVHSGVAESDKETITVSLSYLDSGVYVYDLRVGDKIEQLRFVKQ